MQPETSAPAAATPAAGAAPISSAAPSAPATVAQPAADGGTATLDQAARSCCEVQTEAGCAQTEVQDCVCAQAPSCCQSAWDIVCVQLVDALGCASCKGPCCDTGITTGCSEPAVEACVCAGDATCCSETWDDYCVVLVDAIGCGQCSADPG